MVEADLLIIIRHLLRVTTLQLLQASLASWDISLIDHVTCSLFAVFSPCAAASAGSCPEGGLPSLVVAALSGSVEWGWPELGGVELAAGELERVTSGLWEAVDKDKACSKREVQMFIQL